MISFSNGTEKKNRDGGGRERGEREGRKKKEGRESKGIREKEGR